MKAVVYGKYGQPDVLRLEEIQMPIPGDDEVLVKVRAVSINSWDWDMLTGRPFEYRFYGGLLKPKSNRLHGCDIAGTVEAVGKNVSNFQAGDEVFGDLSEGGWGAFAEYVCASKDGLLLKPSCMSFEEAACLPHGGNLAVQGLVDFGHIKSGQKVLINGGCGSTGVLAIQMAKQFDVEVTGVDSTVKLDMMRSIGADHVIDYTKEDFTRSLRKYDLIFDVKTNRSYFDYKRVLSSDGIYVTVGGDTLRLVQLLLFRKIFKDNNMHFVGYKANKDLEYLAELFEAGKLRPVIDQCFSLDKTADAFRYFGEGRFKGKVIVTVPHDN